MKTEKRLSGIIEKPKRDCDYRSERGVEYYWAPEWVRSQHGTVGRIKPIKTVDAQGITTDVNLYMVARDGNCTYIRGRIQKAFKQWHIDRQIDYLLLGVDEDTDLTPEWDKK
jgi:hypothetical protein